MIPKLMISNYLLGRDLELHYVSTRNLAVTVETYRPIPLHHNTVERRDSARNGFRMLRSESHGRATGKEEKTTSKKERWHGKS